MVSILLFTLNEEKNIQRCLASLSWSDDIVVYDSYSTDLTTEIAVGAGARVVQRKFDNWAAHHNWAHENITFRNEWIFYIDADEIMVQDLRDEILAIAENPKENRVAFRVRRKDFFCGKWIRHCGNYPTWLTRFFKPRNVRWERLVNPVAVINGPEGRLKGHLLHYSFSKGFKEWFDKHNAYSLAEAKECVSAVQGKGFSWSSVWTRDAAAQRKALKELSFRLPFRPSLRFVYMYFVRGGFLDGRAGFIYCRLMRFYEYLIVLKMKEIKLKEHTDSF